MTNKLLKNAKSLISLGISIIPLYHRSKRPESSLISGSWERYKTELTTEYQAERWLVSGWLNYAVIVGHQNLVVIDFDSLELFDLWLLWTRDQSREVQYIAERSFKVFTARGTHVYVTAWERTENERRFGIDIQAQGKYVVGPGCVHPNGEIYQPVGEMIFPYVFGGIDSILPRDLFPLAAGGNGEYHGPAPVITPTTEWSIWDTVNSGEDLDLISKVKSEVRIESFFSDLQRTSTNGRWYAVRCPFHSDNRPSAWIDTKRQLMGCNVCNFKPMDVINLWSRMHDIPESVAVGEMAKTIGI